MLRSYAAPDAETLAQRINAPAHQALVAELAAAQQAAG
jgi:hypothetical protein